MPRAPLRVVARRPDQRDAVAHFPAQHRGHKLRGSTRGQPRRLVRPADKVGVGIEVAAPARADLAHARDVCRVMHATEQGIVRRPRGDGLHPRQQSGG